MRVFKTIPTILQVNMSQLFSKWTSTPFLVKHFLVLALLLSTGRE